jgi:hypothetical protein
MPIARSADGSSRPARLLLVLALPLLISCSDHPTTGPGDFGANGSGKSAAAVAPIFIIEPTVMNVPTYDGSNQSVHPDVVAFDNAWHGARYWLTMTPYPGSDQHLENPSILRSDDGLSVGVPTGLTNPVIRAPRKGRDYNSDPELLYESPTDRLVLFYRLVEKRTNTLRVSTSRDGVNWTASTDPFWEHAHNLVSPTIAPRSGAPARMWYVQTGKKGCQARSTKVVTRVANDAAGRIVDARWTGPVATDLSIPGYNIWHIKARWIPSRAEYWMLLSAFPVNGNGCRTDDLFFARSADGTHWTTYAQPILRHGDRDWTAGAVYRTSFLYNAASDAMSLWISGRGTDGAWHIGYSRVRFASLLSALENGVEVGQQSRVTFMAPAMSQGDEP